MLNLPLAAPAAGSTSRTITSPGCRQGASLRRIRLALALAALPSAAAAHVVHDHAWWTVHAPRNAYFGEGVALLADLDHDGHAEVAVINRVEAVVFCGLTGKELAKLPLTPGNAFERYLAASGDVDSDGTPDIITGWADWNGYTGEVQVFSGRTFAQLHRFTGSAPIDNYGRGIADAGDVDNDGHDDVIIGATMIGQQWSPGYAEVRSGKDGSLLYQWKGQPNTDDVVGLSVAGVGDLDRDGHADVAVGRFMGVDVYSGRTGAKLPQLAISGSTRYFGSGVAGIGDVDRDGTPDIGFVEPRYPSPSGAAARVWFHSGRTGAVIAWVDARQRGHFIDRLFGLGDVDGDGWPEVAFGGSGTLASVQIATFDAMGKVHTLVTIDGPSNDGFASAFAGGEDVTGDGIADIVVGAPQATLPAPGYAQIFSGTRLRLTADSLTISALSGGKQTLRLHTETAHAGRPYWMLGSLTGLGAGVPIGTCKLPLAVDGYTIWTLQYPNTPLLSSSQGLLDANGDATATLTLPPGLPALVGLTAWHSFLVLDGAAACVQDANAVPATFVQ